MATLQAIADMGCDGVEFYGIYFDWTTAYAKDVRKRLDALGLRCFSNHTRRGNFAAQDFAKVIELNQILGSKYVIMAHSEKVDGEDDWKRLAATLTAAHEQLRPLGLRAGFHNYPVDFRPIGNTRPIDILAAHTPKDFCFQVDTVGTLMAGADLVAFVKANAGRVKSYHLKDWKPGDGGGRILLGEGIGDWKALFDVAESVGGVVVLPHRAGRQQVHADGDGQAKPRNLSHVARHLVETVSPLATRFQVAMFEADQFVQ